MNLPLAIKKRATDSERNLLRILEDDERVLTLDEIASLKSLAHAYSMGKFLTGCLITLCGIGGSIIEIWRLIRGH